MARSEPVGEVLDPGFDPCLLAGLGEGVVLTVGDDLGRYGRRERCRLGWYGALQLVVTQKVGHHEPPSERDRNDRSALSEGGPGPDETKHHLLVAGESSAGLYPNRAGRKARREVEA